MILNCGEKLKYFLLKYSNNESNCLIRSQASIEEGSTTMGLRPVRLSSLKEYPL